MSTWRRYKQVRHRYIQCLRTKRLTKPTATYFQHPLYSAHPLVLLALFMALVLNVLGQVSRETCKFTLRMLKMMVDHAFHRGAKPSPFEQRILDRFPTDIRSVRRAFDLEAKIEVYASCPKCCCNYAPQDHDGITVYPAICTNRKSPRSKPCGTRLTGVRVTNGQSVRSPRRPFAVQCFDTFVGNLLTRPGVEELVERMSNLGYKDVLNDVSDGEIIRSILTPAGTPFIDPHCGETRLVWALSVDWFNPYHNKIAGKTASIGSVVLTCLSLPPSLRYKPENMYLMGIIPGPKEPRTTEMNHYLRPLIDKFLVSYHSGTWYTRTYRYPRGRRSRSALAIEICDLPGARKVSGHASHSAENFCMFCHLRKSDINNLDCDTWTERTHQEILEAALAYQKATTNAAKKTIFKKSGVRYSELVRLPYWNHRRVAIDGMHMLFMGVVQHHCRVVLGMDVPSGGQDAAIATPKDIERARAILENKPTASALKRVPIAALRALSESGGLAAGGSKQSKKKDVIAALLVCSLIGWNWDDNG